MKVGILTCHAAYNYGSVLQAYALQEAIRKLGCDCEVIDYRPFWFDRYRVFYWENPFARGMKGFARTLVKNAYNLLCIPLRLARMRKFESYMAEHLRMSAWRGGDGEKLPEDYDMYVVGSDQVWNPVIFGASLPYYMGCFRRRPGARLVGYAISAGEGEGLLTAEQVKDTERFSALSVREPSMQSVLKRATGRDCPVVLDPTMLVGRDFWMDRSHASAAKDGGYVLVYMVYPVHAAVRQANALARKLSCRVRVVSSCAGVIKGGRIHQEGPDDFVNLVRNSRAVITTSFHGTVFSLVFCKPFYYLKSNFKGETRQRTLLAYIGLEDRMADANAVLPWSEIDYDVVWRRLDGLREESAAFLRDAVLGEKACDLESHDRRKT